MQGGAAGGRVALLRLDHRRWSADSWRGVLRHPAGCRCACLTSSAVSAPCTCNIHSEKSQPAVVIPAGTVGVAPSVVQRSLLILLERMGPYLAERISSAARAPSDSDSGAARTLQDAPAAEPAASEQPAPASRNAGQLALSGAPQPLDSPTCPHHQLCECS